MTIHEYCALRTLEEQIHKCEHFNKEIETCLWSKYEKNYIKFIKDFDIELQREVLIALQSTYEKRIQALHDEFNRLLEK